MAEVDSSIKLYPQACADAICRQASLATAEQRDEAWESVGVPPGIREVGDAGLSSTGQTKPRRRNRGIIHRDCRVDVVCKQMSTGM